MNSNTICNTDRDSELRYRGTRTNNIIFAPSEPANAKSRLTMLAAAVTSTKFCSYHHGHADAATGAMLMKNKIRKWMCANCMSIRGIAK